MGTSKRNYSRWSVEIHIHVRKVRANSNDIKLLRNTLGLYKQKLWECKRCGCSPLSCGRCCLSADAIWWQHVEIGPDTPGRCCSPPPHTAPSPECSYWLQGRERQGFPWQPKLSLPWAPQDQNLSCGKKKKIKVLQATQLSQITIKLSVIRSLQPHNNGNHETFGNNEPFHYFQPSEFINEEIEVIKAERTTEEVEDRVSYRWSWSPCTGGWGSRTWRPASGYV